MTGILKIIPLMQSTALLSANVKFAKKKKKSVQDFVGMGVTNIVGASIIKETSDFLQ